MFFLGRFFKKKKKNQQLLKVPSAKISSWNLKKLFSSSSPDILSTLEEVLLTSDVGVGTTTKILSYLQEHSSKKSQYQDYLSILNQYLDSLVLDSQLKIHSDHLNIIFVFGVNGVGKTTSIAKMANYLKISGENVLLAAADTYRAAAVDQLKMWAQRIDIPLISHEGKSKPAAVVYDAVESAIAKKKTVLLIDTAGRFHNREDLLEELSKLKRIIEQKAPQALVQNLLVLDSTTGQNTLEQARRFHEFLGISGVFLSKWDSSGKGGVVLTLSSELSIPVYFIGTGEQVTDLQVFNKQAYIQHLIS